MPLQHLVLVRRNWPAHERELVAREAVAADEGQVVGRCTLGDLEAGAGLSAEEPREHAVHVPSEEGGHVLLERPPDDLAESGDGDRVLIDV